MDVYTNYKYSPAAEDKTSAAGGLLKTSGKLQIQNSILNSKCKSRFHFNSTLSTGRGVQSVALLKWRVRAKVTFTLTDGGRKYCWQADAIIIRRADVLKVHDYARQHCCLRDYLLIRLPMKIGLRTGEICSLRVEDINFQERTFQVLDSKKKRLYPLPLDAVTLQLIQDLVGSRREGYVFTREVYSRSWSHVKAGLPLRVGTVEVRVKRIAEAAGVKGFTPRLLRHFFAAEWYRRGGSLELLRRILRHKSLAYTQFYLSRLVYFEDLQGEYQKLQSGPILDEAYTPKPPPQTQVTQPTLPEVCRTCGNLSICRLVDQMPVWATGCRYYKRGVVSVEKNRFSPPSAAGRGPVHIQP